MKAKARKQIAATTLLPQQVEALRRIEAHPLNWFALGMEQGTGKTLVLIENSLREFERGEIDAVLILAPNGVHMNWTVEELPKHLPKGFPAIAQHYWSGMGKRAAERLDREMFAVDVKGVLRFLSINIESLNTKSAFTLAHRFVSHWRTSLIIDESHYIKNPRAGWAKAALALRDAAKKRYIASGTMMANSPIDLFNQFEFCERGALGHKTLTTFKARYCELLPPTHGVMRHILDRLGRLDEKGQVKKGAWVPQVIARDEAGRPKYKNLGELNKKLAPIMYRVLRSECMNLPEKRYSKRFFELTEKQRAIYVQMRDKLRIELADGTVDTVAVLNAGGKLQQIASNFFIDSSRKVSRIGATNPRLELLQDVISGVDLESESVIVWAAFVEEIREIMTALTKNKIRAEKMVGETSAKERAELTASFQAGEFPVLVANAAVGGTGRTLTKGTQVIYYSNSLKLTSRLQSEDRSHRIGQTMPVSYVDLIAVGTVDEKIVDALEGKKDLAAAIYGDIKK